MVTAWLLSVLRNLKEQNKYMKAILWAYANDKISDTEEAQQALKIVETWEGNDDTSKRPTAQRPD